LRFPYLFSSNIKQNFERAKIEKLITVIYRNKDIGNMICDVIFC